MTSKQRVNDAANLKEPDRVPADMWATEEELEKIKARFAFTAQEDLLHQFGCDIRLMKGVGVEGSPVKSIGPELKTLPDGLMDIYCYHDDYGSQSGLLMSPEFIGKYFAKYYRCLNELACKHNLKVFMHSDGAVRPLIPDFIDWGVDILNPIQAGAAGMAPAELNQEFGKHLCFHGAIDTQHTLPLRSASEVKDEVRQGGGLVLCPDQTM